MLRHEKVILATNADVDGMPIRNLMITYFFHVLEQLVPVSFLCAGNPAVPWAHGSPALVYLGKNTPGRKDYIMEKLVVPVEE